MPKELPSYPLGTLLERVRNPVVLQPATEYREIGIRSHGKGIFLKETTTSEKLGNKAVFWVEPNCFIVNIVFAWEQAIAKTTPQEKGLIASHRFPMYRPDPSRLDLDYLVSFFRTSFGKYLLGLASPGGAGRNKTLGQDDFLRLEIPLPPLSEQRRISEIIGCWDRGIEIATRAAEAAQLVFKAHLKQLITDSDAPIRSLGDISKIRRGASPRPISNPKFFADSGPGWIRISDVSSQGMRLRKTDQYLSPAGANASVEVKPGQLIMSICATIGVPIIVEIPACIHDGFVLFTDFESHLDTRFLYFCLKAQTDALAAGGQPGTQKNLNTGIVNRIKVPVPPRERQDVISGLLEQEFRYIETLRAIAEKLKLQKEGLMLQLHTGRIRVRV